MRSAWTTAQPRASRAAVWAFVVLDAARAMGADTVVLQCDPVLRPCDVQPGDEAALRVPDDVLEHRLGQPPLGRDAAPAWPRPGSRAGSARSTPPAPRTAMGTPGRRPPRGARSIAASSWAGVTSSPSRAVSTAASIAGRRPDRAEVHERPGDPRDRDLADPGHVEVREIGPMHLRDAQASACGGRDRHMRKQARSSQTPQGPGARERGNRPYSACEAGRERRRASSSAARRSGRTRPAATLTQRPVDTRVSTWWRVKPRRRAWLR